MDDNFECEVCGGYGEGYDEDGRMLCGDCMFEEEFNRAFGIDDDGDDE